jgi:hypothetical protein
VSRPPKPSSSKKSKPPQPVGSRLLRFDALGTGAFVISAASGVINTSWIPFTAIVSGLLFCVGMAAMLWTFGRAVQRSRTEAIGMGGLYFLAGDTAPAYLRRPFMVLLAVQVVGGFAAAASHVYTAMAACVLVPVFGIGMGGLWGSRYGVFPPRVTPKAASGRGGNEVSGSVNSDKTRKSLRDGTE